MKKILLPLLLLVLLFTFKAEAQNPPEHLIQKGIKSIYALHFDDAETTFRQIIADYPNHPSGRFFLAMVDWWRILLNMDDESNDELFLKKLEDVIYQCDVILEKDPNNTDALFFKGGAIGFRGRLRANRDSWLKAADDGREALPIVKAVGDIDKSNKDVDFGKGLYNYYVAVIPDLFPYVKPVMIFFPSGDRELGLQQLRNAAENGKYSKYEARYFLLTIYFNYENDLNLALQMSKQLHTDFPDNSLFHRYLGRVYVRRGNAVEWHNTFDSVYTACKNGKFGYNDNVKRESAYYLGLFYKSQNSPDTARVFFDDCLALCKKIDKEDSGFKINTTMFLADYYFDKKDFVKAKELYTQLLDLKDYNNSRKTAKERLSRINTD